MGEKNLKKGTRLEAKPSAGLIAPEGVHTVMVKNSLLNKKAALSSGETTYQGIQETVLAKASSGTKSFMFDFDTMGGEAQGMFPLISALQSYKKQFGLSYTGVINGYCCSAGYGIASVMDKLYIVDGSETASIGAVAGLRTSVKRDKAKGVQYTILRSRSQKARGGEHEKLDKGTIKRMKAELSDLDSKFVSLLAETRGISEDVIDELDGAETGAENALRLGLVDKIIPFMDMKFIKFKSKKANKEPTMKKLTAGKVSKSQKKKIGLKAVKAYKAQAALQSKSKGKKQLGGKALLKKQRKTNTKILALCTAMDLPTKSGLEAIEKGMSFKQARTGFNFAYKAMHGENAIYQEDQSSKMPAEFGSAVDGTLDLSKEI